MTAQIAAYGRITADIQTKTTSNGNHMAFTRMAVSLPCMAAENGRVLERGRGGWSREFA